MISIVISKSASEHSTLSLIVPESISRRVVQHHRDAEEAPGEAVRAGGVAVAVESPATEKVLLSHEFDMRLSNYNQHKYHGEFEGLPVVLSAVKEDNN